MNAKANPSEFKLTGKQRMFADFYLGDARFVATEAARLSGYKGNYATLAAIASENLKKPNIRLYIDSRMEALSMSANSVLARLTEIANGKVDDLLDDDGRFDLEKAKEAKKTHLIKKIKVRPTEYGDAVELELYSAHDAIRDLGKHHKLFTEKHEVSGSLGFSWGEIVDDSGVRAGSDGDESENLTDAD